MQRMKNHPNCIILLLAGEEKLSACYKIQGLKWFGFF